MPDPDPFPQKCCLPHPVFVVSADPAHVQKWVLVLNERQPIAPRLFNLPRSIWAAILSPSMPTHPPKVVACVKTIKTCTNPSCRAVMCRLACARAEHSPGCRTLLGSIPVRQWLFRSLTFWLLVHTGEGFLICSKSWLALRYRTPLLCPAGTRLIWHSCFLTKPYQLLLFLSSCRLLIPSSAFQQLYLHWLAHNSSVSPS